MSCERELLVLGLLTGLGLVGGLWALGAVAALARAKVAGGVQAGLAALLAEVER